MHVLQECGGNIESGAKLPWEACHKDTRGIIWIDQGNTIGIYNETIVSESKVSI